MRTWPAVSLVVITALLMLAVLLWSTRRSSDASGVPLQPAASAPGRPPLRLGLIPESDIFAQRVRYQALTGYLATALDRPVELVTLSTYEGVLADFAESHIDGAFLGSLVGVLSHDRFGTAVVVKPHYLRGGSTYRGVLFVREDSPITDVAALPRKSIAMVRTTMAGNLYPIYLLVQHGLTGKPDRPEFRWVGTHDDVVEAVMEGHVDCGAVKDHRLDAYLEDHPQAKVRRLATSPAVPGDGLFVRKGLDAQVTAELTAALLGMADHPEGRKALEQFGADRFEPCTMAEYQPIYDMLRQTGDAWAMVGISGPRPAERLAQQDVPSPGAGTGSPEHAGPTADDRAMAGVETDDP